MRYLYSYGLPFSEKLGENIKPILKRIDINKASLIVIDGPMGEGKTTLAVEIADFVNKENGLPPIELDKNNHVQYAMGGDRLAKQLLQCYEQKLPVVIYDEAGDYNTKGTITRSNRLLGRIFETYRTFKILIIVCLPFMPDLDSQVFKHAVARFGLHLEDRTETQGNFRGYSLYRMYYVRKKASELIVPPFAYKIVEPNFYGHFLDLEPRRSELLNSLSTKGKADIIGATNIKKEGLYCYEELITKVGRSQISLSIALSKMKIKPVRIYKRKRYFNEMALSRLYDYFGNKDFRKNRFQRL
jgi:energy-coupling factor transporter ATP-binding protein EcfA2